MVLKVWGTTAFCFCRWELMTKDRLFLFPQTDQQAAARFSWENQPVAVKLAQGTTKPTRLDETPSVLVYR